MPSRAAGLRTALAFLALYAVLYFALAQWWGVGGATWVIDDATVRPAAWLARVVSGDPTIVAAGSHLESARARINILSGCEGTDVLLVLLAAIWVAPAPLSRRLPGAVAGTGVVFVLNQARVISLFFILRERPEWFSVAHGLAAPLALVALVACYFLAWLDWANRPARADAGLP